MRIFYTFIFLTVGLTAFCQPETVSLTTDKGDRISLTYEITEDGDDLLLSFSEASVKSSAGKLLDLKGKKGDDLLVVLFDRRGNLPSFSSDETIVPLAVPPGLEYAPSSDGVFFLQDGPVLKFKRPDRSRDVELSLPVYIAGRHLLKEGYKLMGRAELGIHLDGQVPPESSEDGGGLSDDGMSMTSPEAGGRDYSEINMSISRVKTLVEQQMSLPFSETFMLEVANLRAWADDGSIAPSVREKIQSALKAYEKKSGELEQEEKDAKQQAQADEERRKAEELAEKQEQELKELERMAEEKKSRLKMIIGGILLAVVSVIGNQFLQYFRNMKTQEGMMKMQEQMADKAQKKAEGGAKQMAAGGVNKVKKEIGRKKEDIIKNTKNDRASGGKNQKTSGGRNGEPKSGGPKTPRYKI